MPAVYLIRVDDRDDARFTEGPLLAPLASLGFDRLISARPTAMESSAAVLILAPRRPERYAEIADEAEAALRSRTPVVVVQNPRGGSIADGLSTAATIPQAVAADDAELWRRLARLLKTDAAPDDELPTAGEPLTWSTEAFSLLLADAARRSDFRSGTELLDAFVAHVEARDEPYPAKEASDDLKLLRARRQFVLMSRYAEAAIREGSTDHTVRRQFAQALIELKQFDAAIEVLGPVAEETAPVPPSRRPQSGEHYEARGLIARGYKQRYIDEGQEPQWLQLAIQTYWDAYREEHDNTWHGINAASCILRAFRDGVTPPKTWSPAEIAREILATLDARKAADGELPIWDAATQVEALVDLGEFDEAELKLLEYLTHPKMTPFEVTSTYRQFDEVLQLGSTEQSAKLFEPLVECVIRLRAGGRIATATADATEKWFLLRIADPNWLPSDDTRVRLGTRFGSIVTMSCSRESLKKLLKDPLVISIEESRPTGAKESEPLVERAAGAAVEEHPLDFIRCAETYSGKSYKPGETGLLEEKGADALVAVIDDGIDVLHAAFRNEDGSSCIVAVWDQTDPDTNMPPGRSGRLHTAEDIAGYIRAGEAPAHLRAGDPHGTQVASIAVGRPFAGFRGGVAPKASLLVVIPEDKGAVGYSVAYKAALDFIDEMATQLNLPVVVNVSQGMNAGAHDGRSSLEAGFDEFCNSGKRGRGRVVVKSAGNERDKRGHAKLTVPPGGIDELTWYTPPFLSPIFSSTVRLELWWDSANWYRFQLRSPGGKESEWVDRENPYVEDMFAGQGDYKIELTPISEDNESSMLRIELDRGKGISEPPDKCWQLTVLADTVDAEGDIHAWIERHNEPTTTFTSHSSEEMTLSVPGTARFVITVGAVGPARPIRVGSFSSFGPTRNSGDERKRPDICAPGVGVSAAKSGTLTGVVTGDGTSLAAPYVTGAMALALSRSKARGAEWPTSSHLRAILRRNNKLGNKFWDRGQGYGVLDVTKLLEDGLPTVI